ncbi:voltage-gated shaker-like K+ channel, subunit [Umbelopsis sp. PMI_123]|nr:voltage-gated shaker-like K+ channel, subunit [Umbelopsis sp. PMI_123]
MTQASDPQSTSLLRRYRQLAPSASVRVSPLCLGAMNFGEAYKDGLGECTKETSFAILDHFISQGGNFIDTANMYQNGESEMWLGEWMASRKNRDEIVLATKYCTAYKLHHKDKIQANYGGNGLKSMRISVEESLKNLQTTYIDLLYLHWWDFTVSIPELMHGLNDLVSSGKVIYLGISNTPAWIVVKCNQYARENGLRQFTVYQGLWNAAIRDFEREIIPMCRDEGMGLLPYGALGQGRFHTEEVFKERETNNPGRKGLPYTEREKRVSKVLEKIAKTKGTIITSVAMAYVRQKVPYVFPIVGGRTLEHLRGNIEGLSLYLTKEEFREIEQAYEFDPGYPHTYLSGNMNVGGELFSATKPGEVYWTKSLGTFDWVEVEQPIGSVEQ